MVREGTLNRKDDLNKGKNLNFGNNQKEGMSYANAVVGGGVNGQVIKNAPRTTNNYNRKQMFQGNRFIGLEFNVNEDDMAWLKDCFVRRASHPEGINCLKKKFLMETLLSVLLTPMGGNSVLI